MKVTEIKSSELITTEIQAKSKKDIAVETRNIQKDKLEIKSPTQSQSTEILLKSIEKLENTKHLDNIHPLDRMENTPIETFQEALAEVQILKSRSSSDLLFKTQANLLNKNVLSLFISES